MQVKSAEQISLPTSNPEKRFFGLMAIFVIAAAAFLTVYIEMVAPVSYKQTDIIPSVVGLREVVQRHSPYTREVTSHIQRLIFEDQPGITPEELYQKSEVAFFQPFLYPLPQSLILVPVLVPFPEAVSTGLMRFITLASFSVAVLLFCLIFNSRSSYPLLKKNGLGAITLVLALVAVGGGATIRTIWPIVQPIGFALLTIALFAYLQARGKYEWTGVMAFVMLYKPTVTGVLFLGVMLFAALNPVARWRMLKGFLLITIPLTVLAFILVPAWPFDWLKVMTQLSSDDSQIRISYLGGLGVFSWVIMTVVVGLNGWVWWKAGRLSEDSPNRTYYLGLGYSVGLLSALFILPRTGHYDHVVCLAPLAFAWGYLAFRWSGPKLSLTLTAGMLVLVVSSITYMFVQGQEIFTILLILSTFFVGLAYYVFWQGEKQIAHHQLP